MFTFIFELMEAAPEAIAAIEATITTWNAATTTSAKLEAAVSGLENVVKILAAAIDNLPKVA